MADYSFADRLLHRAALQFAPVAEMSFDIDQRSVTLDPAETAAGRHVFVASLARSGTTILMRQLHASGAFRSLTYRDMPFVLAPVLWSRFASRARRDVAAHERAHGDGIVEGADSPAALEEAFWRVMDGHSYIAKTHLSLHRPDADVMRAYNGYVSAILQSDDAGRRRYLCKNNNNALRLPAIRRAFPNALILVPLREPLAHAASLLRQHRRFVARLREDSFERAYMGWLAHHEFGLDHRPFVFAGRGVGEVPQGDSNTLEYWIARWLDAYRWLAQAAPEGSMFVCYEDLCGDPATWQRIARLCNISGKPGEERDFRLPTSDAKVEGADGSLAEASELYKDLRERARSSLA